MTWWEPIDAAESSPNKRVEQPLIDIISNERYWERTKIPSRLSKEQVLSVPILGSYDPDEERIKLSGSDSEYDEVTMTTTIISHEYVHHLINELEGYFHSKYYDKLLKEVCGTPDLYTYVHGDPDFIEEYE